MNDDEMASTEPSGLAILLSARHDGFNLPSAYLQLFLKPLDCVSITASSKMCIVLKARSRC